MPVGEGKFDGIVKQQYHFDLQVNDKQKVIWAWTANDQV